MPCPLLLVVIFYDLFYSGGQAVAEVKDMAEEWAENKGEAGLGF